jgi:hypothetical protein
MKFRNYCIVIMGANTHGSIKLEIEKVSDSKINLLDARGILLATFTSALTPKELSDFFKLNQRNFLLFDLNEENSGFNINKKEVNDGLFGFLKEMAESDLDERAVEFLKDVEMSSSTKDIKSHIRPLRQSLKTDRLTKDDISKMTHKEKNDLQDKIIDNGVENMSEYEKEILSFLWI